MTAGPKRSLRIDDTTWAALQHLADTDGHTLSSYARHVLREHVRQRRLTATNLTTTDSTTETPTP